MNDLFEEEYLKRLRADYRKVLEGDAASAFMQWTKAGGKEVKGLVKRRQAERALFLS